MGKGVKYSADTEGPRRVKGIINQISFIYGKKKNYIHTHTFFKRTATAVKAFQYPLITADHNK